MSPPAPGKRVLITGGAGFLGSHLADRLLHAGYRVRLLDCLDPQVHPAGAPQYLAPEAELQVGNVLDAAAVAAALEGVHAVVHFAAVVGLGQSHYQIARYSQVNVQGTAVLLEEMLRRQRRPGSGLERLLLAGSMSIYGEGDYWCPQCQAPRSVPNRPLEQLRRQQWEVRCPVCGVEVQARPTREDKPPRAESMYALTKQVQEQMGLLFGRTYAVPTISLRFFNTYGPRQALSNPYTGVAAVFAAALLSGHAPQVFEDGQQLRDLVSVHDVTAACRLALEQPSVEGKVLNIASGQPLTVAALATRLARALGAEITPVITQRYRLGDARHCTADITAARDALGFQPQVRLDDGMRELSAWLRRTAPAPRHPAATLTLQEHATAELRAFGLTG